ncbi:hypothetical protein V8G54_022753, partial [Vigna mungo]
PQISLSICPQNLKNLSQYLLNFRVPSTTTFSLFTIPNFSSLHCNLESLQKLLLTKAIFIDNDNFSKAFLTVDQARSIKLLQQRVETLEKELDAAITAAARPHSEKRQAEAAHKVAESHALESWEALKNEGTVLGPTHMALEFSYYKALTHSIYRDH